MARRPASRFNRPEGLHLAGFGGGVGLLHLLGWGLFWFHARNYPALAGLGTLAYTFGLRHAFDSDHLAAIDNTTRKLLQDGKRSVGVGFFFSLGHSTIVFALAASLAVAAPAVSSTISVLHRYGSFVGTGFSGTFLWLIGVLNLLVLIDIVRVLKEMRGGSSDDGRLERRLLDRGLMSRLLLGRLGSKITSSWQMYPLGILFGLGFDTASEVGLLALAARVATHQVPFLAIISLPLLFAAGMSLLDTADGAFMSHAYGRAFSNPVRRVYYNLTVTGLSVAIALMVGTIELLQVAIGRLGLEGGFWRFVGELDLSRVGYAVVGLFVLAWAGAAIVWKAARIEQGWAEGRASR